MRLQVRGFGEQLPLITTRDGSNSNLVRALKGQAPFGRDFQEPGATYRRMPAGAAPVHPAQIAEIENWIDNGAPEFVAAVSDDVAPVTDSQAQHLPFSVNKSTSVHVVPSFKNHISQMFRDEDIDAMLFMYDLSSYDEVSKNSADILACLKGENGERVMPPPSMGGPWPKEWIDLFDRWISEGHPR